GFRVADRFDGYRRGLTHRIAVDAGRDRGERDGLRADLVRDSQRFEVTAREQVRAVLRLRVDGPDRVDHPRGRQIARRGRDRVARREAGLVSRTPDFPALLEDPRTALAMDRAVDAAPAHER